MAAFHLPLHGEELLGLTLGQTGDGRDGPARALRLHGQFIQKMKQRLTPMQREQAFLALRSWGDLLTRLREGEKLPRCGPGEEQRSCLHVPEGDEEDFGWRWQRQRSGPWQVAVAASSWRPDQVPAPRLQLTSSPRRKERYFDHSVSLLLDFHQCHTAWALDP